MDPAAIRRFLQRNPNIREIGFSRSGHNTEIYAFGRPLCNPPAALPKLIQLYASDELGLIALLDAFDSPTVYTIGIRDTRLHAPHVTGLKRALRRLSVRRQPTKLELTPSLLSPGDRIDDEEQAIVRSLHSVERVCLITARLAEAQRVLPWLTLLPALRWLELPYLTCMNDAERIERSGPEIVGFIQAARAALPGVRFDIGELIFE
ncbi:hypothetical protein B0H13DRAFT_793346 [Mycena leptocephala]|nr:hypothetical protein B0H13DRAFT_793346 [Mycena leptocephala]